MKLSKAVKAFLDRNDCGFKHYTFCISNDGQDDMVTVTCREAASIVTHKGGKISKLNTDELALKYAKIQNWTVYNVYTSAGV